MISIIIFKDNDNLLFLSFGNNQITSLPENIFASKYIYRDNISIIIIKDNHNLKYLYLDNNQISSLHENIFASEYINFV